MKDKETKERFVELRSQGVSFSAIAEQLGVSKPTLIDWSKDTEIVISINNLKQIQREALLEKYRLTNKHRLEIYGKQLNAIEDELSKRNLSKMPTERLYEWLVKLTREIGNENQSLSFSRQTFRDILAPIDLHHQQTTDIWQVP